MLYVPIIVSIKSGVYNDLYFIICKIYDIA